MNLHQPLPITDNASSRTRLRVQGWRPALSNVVQTWLLTILGICFATVAPALLSLQGVGMHESDTNGVFFTGGSALVSIFLSLVILRNLLRFPMLRTSTYVAVTFVCCFGAVAAGLKLSSMAFSTHQFFLSMVMMAGFLEGFFAAQRRWRPGRIFVVPGGQPPTNLPSTLSRPINLTFLSTVPGGEVEYTSVVADLSADLGPEWERFLALSALRGIPVHHVKQFNELVTGQVAVDHLWENTLGSTVPSLIYPQFKRALDLSSALLLLPLIALIVGICAILIKRETTGPIFYRQARIGYGGRAFTMYKLRTMTHVEAAAHGQPDYTLKQDPRITRVGRWLRRYRLDELPQIVNVLRGEMSWIGPRPEAISLAQWYERDVAFYIYRHIVKPGISGWAQVHQGNVAKVDAARKKLEYDFFYIKHFSFWLDIVIFVKTVRTILAGAERR
jgi:lipopolysaccharide/colanic/teichoic acid biosynthesis glycosyltransferase